MADYPPLSRYYIASYAANDRDFPVVAIRLDPRTAGYKVPEDLSPHPDSKRYPNHVFTGAQPSSGDQVVTHVYEILPSPWVPFTRYDDDLGPIQGRRRSVKNEGQVASLAADKRVTYEAREGSAIVYTEIEETWSIETDDDGNSLFPIRDRDFYDPSRGAVQERRQLFVPTGEEAGSLENINGVITQTSYEPYNEFLSVKIVQTYSVNGPQLIGNATNNEGQLVTVTTQRKGAEGYVPPSPTATRTVEASREDAEAIVERIVDAPNVFDAKTLSASKPDVIPEAFRASVPAETTQETVAQDSVSMPSLGANDLEKSEQRVTEHTVRKTTTSRDNGILPTLSGQEYEPNVNVVVKYDESVAVSGSKLGNPATIVDPLSDDFDLVREFDLDAIASELESITFEFPSRTNLALPPVLKNIEVIFAKSKETGTYQSTGSASGSGDGSVSGSESGSAQASSSVSPEFNIEIEEIYSSNIPTTSYIFFLKYPVTLNDILQKLNVQQWPVFRPKSHNIVATGQSKSVATSASVSYSRVETEKDNGGITVRGFRQLATNGSGFSGRTQNQISLAKIPPCLHPEIVINETEEESGGASININWSGIPISASQGSNAVSKGECVATLSATSPTDIPRSGKYLIDSRVDLYQYGFARIYAEVLDASIFAS